MNSLETKIDEISFIFEGISRKKLELFFQLSDSILKAKTVCLYKVTDEAFGVIRSKSFESCYQKILNFFCTGLTDLYLYSIFSLVVYLFGNPNEVHLSIDRTTWKVGSRYINLLVIGLVYENICIPLIWQDIGKTNKKGNSNATQRFLLIDELLRRWKKTNVALPLFEISGDREFIGDKWLVGLEERGIKFVFRLKESQKFHVWHKRTMSAKKVSLKSLAKRIQGKQKAFTEIVTESGYIVKLVIIPNTGRNASKQPFLLLVTNIDADLIEKIQQKFGFRWSIECCFKHLKSNGLDLEKINLEADHKIHLMVAILIFLYALCIHKGIKRRNNRSKKYKNGTVSPARSIFRQGLSELKRAIKNYYDLVITTWNILKEISQITSNKFIFKI